jgi:hypothetical protein
VGQMVEKKLRHWDGIDLRGLHGIPMYRDDDCALDGFMEAIRQLSNHEQQLMLISRVKAFQVYRKKGDSDVVLCCHLCKEQDPKQLHMLECSKLSI